MTYLPKEPPNLVLYLVRQTKVVVSVLTLHICHDHGRTLLYKNNVFRQHGRICILTIRGGREGGERVDLAHVSLSNCDLWRIYLG